MTTDAPETRPSRTKLGRALMANKTLTAEWASAFAAVPRSAFLPNLMWPYDMTAGRSVPVSRTNAPEQWHDYADSDMPLVTQWDDGNHAGSEPGAVSTSSASMPSVVFSMLRDLSVQAGNKVLEIGTGTGWNAALLARRLGAENVTSVEVDPEVAQAAREALTRFGLPVEVVTGDGALGYATRAPYDRVIGTCGLRDRIPWEWIEQTRPGGIILAPWGTHFSNGDALARLTVAKDGCSAAGQFTGPVEFMKARAQRLPALAHTDYVPNTVADGDETSTRITEAEFIGEQFTAQRFVLGLRVPGCTLVVADKRDGARPVWLYSLTDRSWACAMFRDGDTARVWQGGARRLWDTAEAAYGWWVDHGRPDHTRFGLTVTREGQSVWLDSPADDWALT
ncbi:methyltransferase domain-containing protein [Streptomyces sp. NPDC058254]|uniref:methyltransferase domain-containing protein n=1 Tax=Streptomyces sp. NPDC058254 TaxID=3346406 RepID=UPI0036E2A1BB